MIDLPEPLVSPEVDLQDFAFMPLDVARLRDSDLASSETPEACWAAVLLWSASWHQIPAASIPNNDQWIAKQAGYASRGRIDPQWKKVRDGALRGWIECSDGRLYHPVVAEKARDAWKSKLQQRWRSECGRIKKHNQRHGISIAVPEFEAWLSLGCPQGQELPVPKDKDGCPQGQILPVPGDKVGMSSGLPQGQGVQERLKGQGQGQGQGLNKEKSKALSGKPDDPPDPEKRKLSQDCAEVLAFLNEKTGRNYLPVKANIQLIAARLREGATVVECRQVIAKKCREWRDDPKQEIYLRPKTLFNATNFANYQGELGL